MEVLKVFVLILPLLGQGTRKRRSLSADCESLADLNFKGEPIGDIAVLLCQHWPNGDFPIQDVRKYEKLLNKDPKELLDELKKDAADKFCWRRLTMAKPSGCPAGYRPSSLKGVFSSVCVSACTESEFTVGCMLGCSKSRIRCGLTLMNQVVDATKVVKSWGSLIKGDTENLLGEAGKVIDFALGVLKRVRDTGRRIWGEQERDGIIALVLTVVYTYKAEKDDLYNDYRTLQNMIGGATKLLYDFLEGSLSLEDIGDALSRYGRKTFQEAVRVTTAFATRLCDPVDKGIAFTVEQAGTEAIVGPYLQNGTRGGLPKYVMKGNPRVGMEYSGRQKAWRFYSGSFTGIFSSNLYLNTAQQGNYPEKGWTTKDGEDPAPEIVPVTTNDGEDPAP